MAVSSTINPRPICHTSSMGNQAWMVTAPAMASMATTTTQNHQYSQPVMNPAALPRPARTYSVNEPSPG